jgi:hypothetical protein
MGHIRENGRCTEAGIATDLLYAQAMMRFEPDAVMIDDTND